MLYDGSGKGNALPLPTRQFTRKPFFQSTQIENPDCFFNPIFYLICRSMVYTQSVRNILLYIHMRK